MRLSVGSAACKSRNEGLQCWLLHLAGLPWHSKHSHTINLLGLARARTFDGHRKRP